MAALTTYALLVAFFASGVLAVYDGWRTRWGALFWAETVLLITAFLILRSQTGFPAIRQPFSETPTAAAIGVMYICVVLGTVANYVFDLKGTFSWKSLARPLVVSPLVLTPLLGTLQGRSEIESVQLIWFALLAFQNGFFWRVVFDRAKPATKKS
jgi:hypothetical protein